MFKKNQLRLIGVILLSLADEAILSAVIIIVLSLLGIDFAWWALLILVLFFLGVGVIVYPILRKSPQLGFGNMIGLRGVTVEPVSRKGTIRINGELWYARSGGEKIEAGVEVLVVEQFGLKLTVIPSAKADPKGDVRTSVLL